MASRSQPRTPPRIVTLANVSPASQMQRAPPRVSSLSTGQGSRTVTLSAEIPISAPHSPHQQVNEVESLRAQVAQQQAQIDVLTRSLEQLVLNYRDLKNESEASRKRDTQTQTRIATVEAGQTEMRRTLETVEYHANVGFQNATADDDARQYMYDEREMIGDDTTLTDGEIQRAASRINDNRRNRRR